MRKIMREFLWGSTSEKKKICWLAWDKLSKPKKLGGLDVRCVRATNRSLLTKWLWRYTKEKDSLWRKIIQSNSKSEVGDVWPKEHKEPYGKGFWKQIQKERIILQALATTKVVSGEDLRFWKDTWFNTIPFCVSHKLAYKCVVQKEAKVKEMITEGRWLIPVRRNSSLQVTTQVADLTTLLGDPPVLSTSTDSADHLESTYTAKEGYNWLMRNHPTPPGQDFNYIWKKKNVPFKAQLCAWFAVQNAVPTVDNLNRRGCQITETNCSLCQAQNEEEEVNHLFLNCSFSTEVWNYFSSRMLPSWVHKSSIQEQLVEWQAGQGSSLCRKTWNILPFVIVWVPWKERNQRVMAKKRGKNKDQIIMEVKRMIYQWGAIRKLFFGIAFGDLVRNWEAVFGQN